MRMPGLTRFPVLVGLLAWPEVSGSAATAVPAAAPHVIAWLNTGYQPDGVAFYPLLDRVYVTNHGSGSVTVINGLNNGTLATITGFVRPTAVAAAPALPLPSRIYITSAPQTVTGQGGTLSEIYSGRTNQVTATVPVGTAPTAVAVNTVNSNVYVTNTGSNTVSVIGG